MFAPESNTTLEVDMAPKAVWLDLRDQEPEGSPIAGTQLHGECERLRVSRFCISVVCVWLMNIVTYVNQNAESFPSHKAMHILAIVLHAQARDRLSNILIQEAR